MTELTRRRDKDTSRDSWKIVYADVGWIGRRAGVPHGVDQWGWHCGFHPGMHPGQAIAGSAETFDAARAAFEAAWQILLPQLTEDAFQQWRHQRDWTERKYAIWARGEKLPSQQPSSLMRCPCGATFDSHVPTESRIHAPHIYAAQQRNGTFR
ncbi:hypothetical protein JQ633_13530 [Bradyrhizobium tropiciagri]|uniref:hypothetical protein n=1 Tax=Bradyrhizobium tropiciagri TaxID=312253 RepID=UPI001BA80331|nr:hypothetical protein [Bradyrhizobium tropiciagri]MBR0871383.1 hypothetical protein [Bradyrhizobium tropiciagri]